MPRPPPLPKEIDQCARLSSDAAVHREALERRESPRGPLLVTASLLCQDKVYLALSQNISGGGMFLVLPELPPLGSLVRLEFPLKGRVDPLIVDAQVVWTCGRRHSQSGLHGLPAGVGVKFLNISKLDKYDIDAYVRSLLPR